MQVENQLPKPARSLFVKHIAVPHEHGSWVFLFSPLLIGLFTAGHFSVAGGMLIIAALAAFMIRQPTTVLVKILSKRRPQSERSAAVFWIGIYGTIGLGALAGLAAMGYGFLIYLAVPALPVFGWHLLLVSRRSERRQAGVEIAGSGALALVAPAAFWVGVEQYDPVGWLLWGLTWLQAAVSIYYAYLRLDQRGWKDVPSIGQRWQAGKGVVMAATGAMLLVAALSLLKIVPQLLPLAYAIQWIESIYGTLKPAVKVKPALIGLRQLLVSTLFTLVFILTWNFI